MKKSLYTTAAILLCQLVLGQTTTENYVQTTTYQVRTVNGTTNATTSSELLPDEKIETITYFDGLGRAKQSISQQAGGQGQDIIAPVVYDPFGRQNLDYLPYVRSGTPSLDFEDPTGSDVITDLNLFYFSKYGTDLDPVEPNPYSERYFEASPLNRILEQGAPGKDWKRGGGHTIRFDYQTNGLDEVKLFDVVFPPNNTELPSLVYDGHYAVNELYKTVVKDENWTSGTDHTTEEFKDKQGRVVLKRTYNDTQEHDIYYIYDDFGNLTYVLSPEGSDKILNGSSINQSVLDGLCYQYRYDHRNRLVEKKIPGKGWEHIVYNKLDQPVLTRDMSLLNKKSALFTTYDAFGRVAYTSILGLVVVNVSRSLLQDYANNLDPITVSRTTGANTIDGTTIYYSQMPLPIGATYEDLFTINYYDSYVFDMDGIIAPSNVFGVMPSTATKGLATGSKVRVLDTEHWITTVTWYDDKGRAICTVSKNPYLGTTDTVKMELDFIGNVLKTESMHKMGANLPIVVTERFTYDHMGRLLTNKHQIGTGQVELISANRYDELGQLDSKKVGGSSAVEPQQSNGLQTVNYSYNIRGWLKTINDPTMLGNDLFSFSLNYNSVNHGAAPLFNGNISESEWRTNNDDNQLKWYGYGYDPLNRIASATDNTSRYNLSGMLYDKNGSIKNLTRKGHIVDSPIQSNSGHFGTMDILTYTYQTNSNRLLKVADAATLDKYGFKDDAINSAPDTVNDYTYDVNGNLISDANKEITETLYNHLNLPTKISFVSGNSLDYVYTAVGTKLSKQVNDGSTSVTKTSYANNYIYISNGYVTDFLKFFNHAEGYVEPDGLGGYQHVYQYKDHLGNIRLSYADTDGNYQSLLDSAFYEDYEGWVFSGGAANGSIQTENGRLKTNVKYQYNGVQIIVSENFSPGDDVSLEIDIDKGNTNIIRAFLIEYDINDNLLGYYNVNSNVATGHYVFDHTMVEGTKLVFKVDKSNLSSDIGQDTYFFVDEVYAAKGELQIVEENNYYPFGLEHKGYNNVVSSNANSIASKYRYNGVEFEEALGLDLYETYARGYDPAIGRFLQIDPLGELIQQIDKTPYNFAWNNPILFNDPDGLCPDCGKPGEEGSTFTIGNGSVYVVVNGEWEKQIEELDEVVVVAPSGNNSSSEADGGAAAAAVATGIVLSEVGAGSIALPAAGATASAGVVLGGVGMGLLPLAFLAYLAENPPPRPSYESLRADPFYPITTQPSPGSTHYNQQQSTTLPKLNPPAYQPLTAEEALAVSAYIDQMAHKRKKQSTGKVKDRHGRAYTHGGKNSPKNPNQRKNADKRKNNGRQDD